jgi:hypothetical protein
MDEDGRKLSPDEALKEAEHHIKRSRAKAKDKKADASIADLTSIFAKMGGKKRSTRRRKTGKHNRKH